MEVTGIIAEYNPFHNGHLYQIEQIRQRSDSLIIAVISGSFTQRGEAAIFDKWQRAKCAVESGCDIVLELPFVFACRSAQDFARGGVELLHRLGIVTQLAFGAENDDLPLLTKLATELDSPDFQKQLHEKIASGLSYAQALTKVLATDDDTNELLHQPNNILAIEYLRSLQKLRSPIKPLLIPRQGAGYHDEKLHGQFASATAIRQALYQADNTTDLAAVLPPATYNLTCQLLTSQNLTCQIPDMNRLFLPLQAKLLTCQIADLQQIHGINEGLENRIIDMSNSAKSWQELIQTVTTKRYPASRIARTLLYLLLNIDKSTISQFDKSGPLYARLLAASPQGREHLHQIKKQSTIPLITKTSQYLNTNKRRETKSLTPLEQMLRLDTIATELRNLTCETTSPRNDFQQSPIIIQ